MRWGRPALGRIAAAGVAGAVAHRGERVEAADRPRAAVHAERRRRRRRPGPRCAASGVVPSGSAMSSPNVSRATIGRSVPRAAPPRWRSADGRRARTSRTRRGPRRPRAGRRSVSRSAAPDVALVEVEELAGGRAERPDRARRRARRARRRRGPRARAGRRGGRGGRPGRRGRTGRAGAGWPRTWRSR